MAEEICQEQQKVRGRRSPNWAVWSRMTIPCKNGLVYLVRRRVIATPLFGIYLHDIHEEDASADPHNHPWSFISIVLRGAYMEKVYPEPAARPNHYVIKVHKPFSVHKMGQNEAHRVVATESGLKTLFLVGRRNASGWGFFRSDGSFVDWKTHEKSSRAF